VLITKLRRLLPIRIEAQWGQGYVISGLAPSQAPAETDKDTGGNDAGSNGSGRGTGNGGAKPQPVIARASYDRVAVTPRTAPREAPPVARELVDLSTPAIRRVISAAPIRVGPRRAEELGVIERFLSERGVTRCPDVATIQQSPLPTLIWDKVKRKWVRPSMTGREAS